jgi:hypothetical protein
MNKPMGKHQDEKLDDKTLAIVWTAVSLVRDENQKTRTLFGVQELYLGTLRILRQNQSSK